MSAAPPDDSAAAREWFDRTFNVSRETLRRFERYEALLVDWQQKFNLVGSSTLRNIWIRHFADSAQTIRLAQGKRWLDMGSGAGFPGLVVALLTDSHVTLVDSVRKKANFLQAVVTDLGLERQVTVHAIRAESLLDRFDVITARACAPLVKLFDWGLKSQAQSATWLLLKGAAAEDEIAEARQYFLFEAELVPSLTDPRGRIVRATNVRATNVRGRRR